MSPIAAVFGLTFCLCICVLSLVAVVSLAREERRDAIARHPLNGAERRRG